MEKLLLILCWIVTVHSLVRDFHQKLRSKRQADLIDFNEEVLICILMTLYVSLSRVVLVAPL